MGLEEEQKRVLVIESSRTCRDLLLVHLQNAGYRVTASNSTREGLEHLQGVDENAVPDIIMLDLRVLGEEEYALLRYYNDHARYTHTDLIFMIQRNNRSVRYKLREVQTPCLLKPFAVQELLTVVTAPAHHAGPYRRPQRAPKGKGTRL